MYLTRQYKAKVMQADEIGHEVMEPGREAYQKILSVFGENILSEDGYIDRKALGHIVFSDQEKLKELNAIIHPAVKEEILRRLARAKEAVCGFGGVSGGC